MKRRTGYSYDDELAELTIFLDQSVYLGFALGSRFGWVELGYDGTDVYVIRSAIDIDGGGSRRACHHEAATRSASQNCAALFQHKKPKVENGVRTFLSAY